MGVLSINPQTVGLQDEEQFNAINSQKQAAELAKNPEAIVTRYNPNLSGETEQEYLRNINFGPGGDMVRDWNATDDASVINGPMANAKLAALGVADALTLNLASGALGSVSDKYTKQRLNSMRTSSMHDIAGAITYLSPLGLEAAGAESAAALAGGLISPGSRLLEKSTYNLATKFAAVGAIDAAAATTGDVVSEHVLYGDLGVESVSKDLVRILTGSVTGATIGAALGGTGMGIGRLFRKRPEIGSNNAVPVGMDGVADTDPLAAAQRQTEKFRTMIDSKGTQPLSEPVSIGEYDVPRYAPDDQIRDNLNFIHSMMQDADQATVLAKAEKASGSVPSNKEMLDHYTKMIDRFESPEGKKQFLEEGTASAREFNEIALWNLRGEQRAGTGMYTNKLASEMSNEVLKPTNEVIETVTKGIAKDQVAFEKNSLAEMDNSIDSSMHLQSTINSMDALEQAQAKVAEFIPGVEKDIDKSTSDFAKRTQRIETLRTQNKQAKISKNLIQSMSDKLEVAMYDLEHGSEKASEAYLILNDVRKYANDLRSSYLKKSKDANLTNTDKNIFDTVNEIINNTFKSPENFGVVGTNNIKQMQARSRILDVNSRFNEYIHGNKNIRDKIKIKGISNKIKQSGPQTGSEELLNNNKVITGFYDEYQNALKDLDSVYGGGKYSQQIELLGMYKQNFSDLSNMLHAKKYIGSNYWKQFLEKQKGESSGERHISNSIRLQMAFKDWESGDPRDAGRQLRRVITDYATGPVKKMIKALTHEDSIESILSDKKKNILDIQKSTNKFFEKVSKFADNTFNHMRSTASIPIAAIPRTIGTFASRKTYEDTDKEFKEKYSRIKQLQDNPHEVAETITNVNMNLSDVNPVYTGKVLNTISGAINAIQGQLPELNSMYQKDFTMSQKAKFLDMLDIYTDPEKIFSQMLSGSASPDVSAQAKMVYPKMYEKVSGYVKDLITTSNKDSSEYPISLYNFINMPSPVMINNYSQYNLPKEQAQQISQQQSANASQSRSGVIKKSNTEVNNYSPYPNPEV